MLVLFPEDVFFECMKWFWTRLSPEYQNLNASLLNVRYKKILAQKEMGNRRLVCLGVMVQRVKVLAVPAWPPGFDSQNQRKSGRRQPSPHSCPLASTCFMTHMQTHIHHAGTHFLLYTQQWVTLNLLHVILKKKSKQCVTLSLLHVIFKKGRKLGEGCWRDIEELKGWNGEMTIYNCIQIWILEIRLKIKRKEFQFQKQNRLSKYPIWGIVLKCVDK